MVTDLLAIKGDLPILIILIKVFFQVHHPADEQSRTAKDQNWPSLSCISFILQQGNLNAQRSEVTRALFYRALTSVSKPVLQLTQNCVQFAVHSNLCFSVTL